MPHRELITQALLDAGFHAAGVIPAQAYSEPNFPQWLGAGMNGAMHWMHDHASVRTDVQQAFPKTESIAVGLVEYGTAHTPPDPSPVRIASYAQGTDYHVVVKAMLNNAARRLEAAQPGTAIRVFVDTSPLNEKRCAELAGLGFIGKHTNFIHPQRGSWSFLALLLSSLPVTDQPAPQTERCGQCTDCLDVCPTRAFPKPFVLDARRCISYLTIEHRGVIPRELRPLMGGWIFGCDLCLAVCPWNRFALRPVAEPFRPKPVLEERELAEWLNISDLEFERTFRNSAVLRAGWVQFLRNCLIAAGNSGDGRLVPAVLRVLDRHAGILRVHALWALHRLQPERALQWCRNHPDAARNTDVAAEMAHILAEV